jgi:hypothetical protein
MAIWTKTIATILFLMTTKVVLAQADTTLAWYPTNLFAKISPTLHAVNAAPATIGLYYFDDDEAIRDVIDAETTTDRLWTYGLGLDLSYLGRGDVLYSYNNYWGFGADFWTATTQLAVGYEFPVGRFFVQPSLGLGLVLSELDLGVYYPQNKAYFEVNNNFIYDGLEVSIRRHTFSINPSVTVDYPLNRYFSLFARATGAYCFGGGASLSLSGETDEVDEEGNYVTARETIPFNRQNVELIINDRRINSRRSPYLPYNFNALQVQIGVSARFGVPM